MHPHKKHLLTSLVLSLIMILIIIFFVVVVFKVDLTELFGIKDFKNEQDDNKKENREKLDQTEEKTNKKDSSSGNLPPKTELI